MTTVDPRISALRAIAVNISWARTANRTERTEPARRRAPQHIDYWIERVRAEGIVTGEREIRRAAEAYYRAHMRRLSLKAAKARQVKARAARRTA